MPVKGLSNVLRLPRRGKIHLGEKRVSEKSGKEYPVALDYFVVPEEVQAVYGEKPSKLDVMLPMENSEIFFPVFYKRYGESRGLICRGDGILAMEIDQETNQMNEIACMGRLCPNFKQEKCRIVGNLQVILYKIKGLGVYQIDTGSKNSIININSSIEMIRGMVGRISWIPLVLETNMEEKAVLIGKKRRRKVRIPIMRLNAEISVNELIKRRIAKYDQKTVMIENTQVDEKPKLLYPSQYEHTVDVEVEGEEITPETARKILKESEEEGILPSQVEKEQKNKIEEVKPTRGHLDVEFHTLCKDLYRLGHWQSNIEYETWLYGEFKPKDHVGQLTDEEMIKAIDIMRGYRRRYMAMEQADERIKAEKKGKKQQPEPQKKEDIPSQELPTQEIKGDKYDPDGAPTKYLWEQVNKLEKELSDEEFRELLDEVGVTFKQELTLEQANQLIKLVGSKMK